MKEETKGTFSLSRNALWECRDKEIDLGTRRLNTNLKYTIEDILGITSFFMVSDIAFYVNSSGYRSRMIEIAWPTPITFLGE